MDSATFNVKPIIRVLMAALAAISVAGSTGLRGYAAEPVSSSIDLAAVILTPGDLAEAGLPGLGFDSGQYATARDIAALAIWPTGSGPELDAMTGEVEKTGFEQAYRARATTNRISDDLNAIVDVEWGVIRYASPEGAAAGFALLPDAVATGPETSEQVTELIGDETRITRIDARDPGAGTPSAELVLGFRTGAVTAHVLLRQTGGTQPSVEQIEQLAQVLAQRIAGETGAERSPLSGRALYLEPRDDMTFRTAAYLRLNGDDLQSAYESKDDLAGRVDEYGDAIDVFSYRTEISASDSDYTLAYATTLYRFANADGASAWLQAQPDQLRASSNASEFVSGAGIDAGDESASMTLTTTPGSDPIRWAVVYVRSGAVVAEITLARVYQAPALVRAEEIARTQAARLGG